ncbi:glycosyltransferase [Corynebacterium cystitidis]|uniref:glycosyltransferase n=1 Tax=Corynebacterium cystitidis TaxID=35757 RepID=UPI00358DADB2
MPTRYPRTLQHRDKLTVQHLVRIAREHNATILHTTTEYKNAIVVSQAAAQLCIPWIYEVRGEPESTWLSRFPTNKQPAAKQSDFYQLSHQQETNAMLAASAVIALSEVSKRSMISRGVSADKIHVIPNAVDESLIGIDYNQNHIRHELGLPSGPIVGTVTSVVGYEGLDDLIRALEFLPDVTCLIVGDGTARPGLEMLADDLSLTNRVIFAGRQPSETIWKWYAALDVFVMPRKDTEVTRVVTPIKGLIAQGLGKNIVASDLPALREVTGNLATYSPAVNAGALTDALRKALTAPQADHQLLDYPPSRFDV